MLLPLLLLIHMSCSIEVPALHSAFIRSKFENTTIPAEKLNGLEKSFSTAGSAGKQVQSMKGFIQKQLPKVKSECTKVVADMEVQLKMANGVLHQTEKQFKPLLGEKFKNAQSTLNTIYNQEGSITRTLPKFIVEISLEAAQLHGKNKTMDALKPLLAWEKNQAVQIKQMNEYFSE